MTTISHKLLTGSQLHEPKGVASAALDTVYISDNIGSGTWGKLDVDSLTGTGKAFQGQLYHVQNQQTSGTDGGTSTAGAWTTSVLNTEVTDELTLTLSGNAFTLAAGTYYSEFGLVIFRSNGTRSRLYNVTDSAVLITSPNYYSGSADSNAQFVAGSGRFTLAAAKSIRLEYYVTTSAVTTGLGLAHTIGTEIYADVKVWKVG